ncbi:MAG: hypothetical protein ACRDQA_26600, partial [Nocardioidaceae bacterium]
MTAALTSEFPTLDLTELDDVPGPGVGKEAARSRKREHRCCSQWSAPTFVETGPSVSCCRG